MQKYSMSERGEQAAKEVRVVRSKEVCFFVY